MLYTLNAHNVICQIYFNKRKINEVHSSLPLTISGPASGAEGSHAGPRLITVTFLGPSWAHHLDMLHVFLTSLAIRSALCPHLIPWTYLVKLEKRIQAHKWTSDPILSLAGYSWILTAVISDLQDSCNHCSSQAWPVGKLLQNLMPQVMFLVARRVAK